MHSDLLTSSGMSTKSECKAWMATKNTASLLSSRAYLSSRGTSASSSLPTTKPSMTPVYSPCLPRWAILASVLMANTLCWRTLLRQSGRSSLRVYPAAWNEKCTVYTACFPSSPTKYFGDKSTILCKGIGTNKLRVIEF